MSRLPLFQMTAGRQCQPLPAGSWFDGSERGRDGGVLVLVGAADEVVMLRCRRPAARAALAACCA